MNVFALSFLGALFAILASLAIVYTYVWLRLIPRLKHGLRAFVEEIGPRAVFERANLDPTEAMRQLGVSPVEAATSLAAAEEVVRRRAEEIARRGAVRIVFTCEDHGRCVGCSKVLAQFEAIVRHQGEDSFDEVEKKCYAQLREQLASDVLLPGESETDRQKRIAARVVEALVRDGYASSQARGVVWATSKDDRATFAAWLTAAREGCVDEGDRSVS